MMDRDVPTAYGNQKSFCCQVQRLVSCIFEFLRNGCFAKEESGDGNYQILMAQVTDRSESLNFSGGDERRTIDELWEVLRKTHVDACEDGMAPRLGENTPFVFCLLAAFDVDKLLTLYGSLREHLCSDIDEDMSDAAFPNESQSSDASSVMDLFDEEDTSMLDEDEDQAVTQQDSGFENDQHMECDSSGIDARPESEDHCLEKALDSLIICDAKP